MFKDITDEFDALQDDGVDTVTSEPSIRIRISKKNKTKSKGKAKADTKETVKSIKTAVDEFADIGDSLSQKYNTSEEDVSNYLISLKNKALSQKTYNGIAQSCLNSIISVDSSEHMPWDHVIMEVDALYLIDASDRQLKELNTFDFVEEVHPVNIDKSNFGLNNTVINKIECIMINKRLSVIEDFSFTMFSKLRKVTIEEGSALTVLGIGAFSGCTELKELDLSKCDLLTHLPSKVVYKSGVKHIKLPYNMSTIDREALAGSNVQTVEVAECTYSKEEFLQFLEYTDYKAFWKNFDYNF